MNVFVFYVVLFYLVEFRCSYDYVEIIDSHPIEYNRNINYNSTHINSNNLTRNQQLKINNEGNASRNIDIFENFLNIYKTHQTYLIQTPEMGSNYDRQTGTSAPRRICGDWNSKVKLLRYRSYGPILGLHFSSDYSHHFGGYKAKVLIKNGTKNDYFYAYIGCEVLTKSIFFCIFN